MTKEEFVKLTRGDIIRHKSESHSWIIDADYGERKTAIQSTEVTNPEEWELVAKANYVRFPRR